MRRLNIDAYLVVEPDRIGYDGKVWSARIAKMTRRRPKVIPGDGRLVHVKVSLPAILLERNALEASIIIEEPA
jgi:hypothetical protein